ncbi:prophage tail fiber N-terminal domain-containing protein [Budviciaceae bacterium CWB-B4]|uniref:Prophage tail fiber N-terminal domain-containing protein n=1 Tax=Limnobaculum xujianqingii TaxID=2738837 RepID=A0A9D7FWM8_9GAMM|nr:prophage tail fiber N-terminal domain-containing protein [Limnobaculum xujianqingii]MBK5072242.1 prophage tail fiber N-terminal domain-containing protein [Limnobaculum xujianqingii]MBK5175551.1 prophage tail fiber N-terminal domain-containing protein [Limnobaculum xujianqingii]
MAIKISGVLRDGMGKPIPKCTIELHCRKTSLTVIVETDAHLGVDVTGAYTMQVEPGKYEVSLYVRGFPPKRVGSIDVYSDSLPGTLNDFLMMPGESDLTPELVLIFQQLRDEARQAADEAKADKGLADNILNDVRSIQTDVTAKQLQVSADALDASNSKTSAAASAATSSDNAASTAADVVTVTALKTSAEAAANSAEASKNAASTDAEKAEQAATSAEASKDSASTDAARAEAARTVSEGIQTDLTQKYDQVVADTATVMAAKTEAVNAATTATADAQATAADRKAVNDDRKIVYADKEAAKTAATTAINKAAAATTEADRAKTEADRAVAATDGKQDKNDLLTAISELTTSESQIIYTTGVNQVSTISLTNVGKSLISAENAAAALSSLGISDVITESNSIIRKNNPFVRDKATWSFEANGGIYFGGTPPRTGSGDSFLSFTNNDYHSWGNWQSAPTGILISVPNTNVGATSLWKAVKWNVGWVAGLDVHAPGDDITQSILGLHVHTANFMFGAAGSLQMQGVLTCSSVVQTSDENRKHDIEDISNADEIIMSISGKTFRMNFDDRPSAGVIAQEVMEKFPVAVTVLPDGSLGVDYSTLHAPIIEAMKNRINKEAGLIKRIKALEKRLNTLAK